MVAAVFMFARALAMRGRCGELPAEGAGGNEELRDELKPRGRLPPLPPKAKFAKMFFYGKQKNS